MESQENVTVSYEPLDCRPKIRYFQPDYMDSSTLLIEDPDLMKNSDQYQSGLLACDSVSQVVNYVNSSRHIRDSLSLSAVLASISMTNTRNSSNHTHKNFSKRVRQTLQRCFRPRVRL